MTSKRACEPRRVVPLDVTSKSIQLIANSLSLSSRNSNLRLEIHLRDFGSRQSLPSVGIRHRRRDFRNYLDSVDVSRKLSSANAVRQCGTTNTNQRSSSVFRVTSQKLSEALNLRPLIVLPNIFRDPYLTPTTHVVPISDEMQCHLLLRKC